jgi:ankyrin repeat protein
MYLSYPALNHARTLLSLLYKGTDFFLDMTLIQNGWTTLHYACCGGHVEVVKALLNKKADVNLRSNVRLN